VSSLLYLTRGEVSSLLPGIVGQLDLVERTYRAHAAGLVELPPKPGIHPRPESFIHAMPAYLRDDDVAVLKWVAGYPANKEKGLPYINGLMILSDPETGVPTAVMDAAEITAARTAAASGVCVQRFAPDGWGTAAVLGCGEQGRFHARVLDTLNAGCEIRAYDPHPERAGALPGNVVPCETPREAVRGAEVVITAGPIVRNPPSPLSPDWLGERWLVLPVDFDLYFQAATIAAADLFVSDDVAQFEYYREFGHFRDWPAPAMSVGEALGRDGRADRVACCNLGVGALDAAFAKHVANAALAAGTGTMLPL
jgi:ornithine cyclodeaminase/alanine dehydrogenase